MPCLSCKETIKCIEVLLERAKDYDEERDGGEDYNSESILMLGKECSQLNDFLFLDEVLFQMIEKLIEGEVK